MAHHPVVSYADPKKEERRSQIAFANQLHHGKRSYWETPGSNIVIQEGLGNYYELVQKSHPYKRKIYKLPQDSKEQSGGDPLIGLKILQVDTFPSPHGTHNEILTICFIAMGGTRITWALYDVSSEDDLNGKYIGSYNFDKELLDEYSVYISNSVGDTLCNLFICGPNTIHRIAAFYDTITSSISFNKQSIDVDLSS